MTVQVRNAELVRLLKPDFASMGAGGAVHEGPGIDLTLGSTIGLGGDTALLYDSGGSPVREFAPTGAGLAAAIAAATSGDTILLPSVTISSTGFTLSAGVALVGMFGVKSRISLTGSIVLSGTNLLKDLWLNLSLADATDAKAVVDGGIDNEIVHCKVISDQDGTGGAHAISLTHSGTITCRDCYLEGSTAGPGVGYAGYWQSGWLYVIGGEVKGSVANQPFNIA